MSRKFKVEYYDPSDASEVFSDLVSAASAPEARAFVESNGYALRGKPEEVASDENPVAAFLESVRTRFSVRTYDAAIEASLLKSFAIGIRDGLPPVAALTKAKAKFWRSNRAARAAIDELIAENARGGIKDWFDLFSRKEEMFSDSFLTAMRVACTLEANPVKIISNPVPPEKKGREVEGYVEMTESMNGLKEKIVSSVFPPLVYFALLVAMVFWVLAGVIPSFIKAFSKIRDVSKDDYTFIGNFTLWTSEAVTTVGPYLLAASVVAAFAATILMKSNAQFRFAVQKTLLKAPIVGDILTVFFTKKAASLWAMFSEAWMKHSESLPAVASVVPFDPMKRELVLMSETAHSEGFGEIFRRIPEDERYFTETFYSALETEGAEGRYGRAFAEIIKNAEDMWETDLSKYPKKLGAYIMFGGLATAGTFVAGLLLIFVKTVFNSI